MSSNARIFLAGVLTTFVILALGFSGGLMLAQSALKEPFGNQTRVSSGQATPVRVILPASAEPAQPPQASTVAVPASGAPPQAHPLKEVQAPVVKQVEDVDSRKADAAEQRRKRYAARKSKRMAARARKQMEQMRERGELGILAFGGDEPRTVGPSEN